MEYLVSVAAGKRVLNTILKHQPTHRGGRVDLQGDGAEADAVAIKHIDHPGEVRQRARQPVDLINNHDVNLAHLDVRHQAAQGWPIHIAAGEKGVQNFV